MATFRLLLALLSVTACVCSDVVYLTPENYHSTLDAAPLMLVKFYAPWCGHCQQMQADYEQAASALKQEGIPLAEVDCIAYESLAEQANIQGFPTLKMYRHGVFYREYMGGRDASDFIDFMQAEAIKKTPEEIGDPDPEEPAFEDLPDGEEQFYDENGEPYEGEHFGEGEWPEEEYYEPKGYFILDKYNFDKVVGTGKFDILVKFDVMYPEVSTENEFAKLTERVGNIQGNAGDELVIGAVHIADFDSYQNEDLRQRYDLEMESLPRYYLFKKSATSNDLEQGIEFGGPINADAIAAFLMENLGIYIGLPGCIKELDRLAVGFLKLDKEGKENNIQLAKLVAAEVEEGLFKENAEFYVMIMEQLMNEEEPDVLIAHEKERLSEELRVGGFEMPEEQRTELTHRVNIITLFEEIIENPDF